MQRSNRLIALTVFLCGLFSTLTFAADANSPIGYWQTVDDVTGKTKSIVQITETNQHELIGTIIKIYPKPGKDENEVCTECKGERHNQRMVGMTVMYGLKHTDTGWDNGEILDPENGKTYSCMIRTENNGKKLNVHGYIGMPLLGRSQIWDRVDTLPEHAA